MKNENKNATRRIVQAIILLVLLAGIGIGAQMHQSNGGEATTNIIAAKTTKKTKKISLTPPARKTVEFKGKPFTQGEIAKTFFADITLAAPMSNRFYHDEIYFVEGDIAKNIKGANEAFVFLCKNGQGCENSINFIGTVKNNHFKIPVLFEAGNYQLGIIIGRSGQSRIADISVLPEPEMRGAAGKPAQNISVKYKNGDTIFSWDGSGSVARLVVFQGNKRKDFVFRQKTNSFAPQSKDFKGFSKGKAGWFVENDGAASKIQEISLITKEFRTIETGSVEIKKMREAFEKPGRFIFRAKALAAIAKKATVTLPDGTVLDIEIAKKDIPKGKEFSVEMDLAALGTYIFEINDPFGAAVVNVPIYVGKNTPLVPDFFALNEASLNTSSLQNLDETRKKLLGLINKDRKSQKLKPVKLSEELNAIAQAHTENMNAKNFFGHVNPEGKSPDDRRKEANYPAAIRENLGKAASIELIEAGLMRSPIHRAAIIDSGMTLVGLGIVKNAQGYYLVTQNFSGKPLSSSGTGSIENDLFNKTNTRRAQLGFPALAHDSLLREISSQWSDRMANENFFGTSDSSGVGLLDIASGRGVNVAIQAYIVETSGKTQLEEELLKQEAILESSNGKIGIGVAVKKSGEAVMTVMYTK